MRYRINFASYDRSREVRRKQLRVAAWAVLALSVVVLAAGVKKTVELAGEVGKMAKSREELAAKVDKLAAERSKIISAEELALLEKKLTFYSGIAGSRRYITVFLNMIEEKAPGQLVLKTIDYDPARKNYVVTGESFNPEAVAHFIPNLQAAPGMRKVEIVRQSFQRRGERKTPVAEFEVRGELF